MTDRLKGGWRCGAVGYEIALSGDLPVYCCHCLDCQKWSGSAFAEQGVIREDAIKTQGPVITSPVTSRQGGQTIQYVCGICHSRIYSTNPARPSPGLKPVSSAARRSRYLTVFGCTNSIRAVASSELPCSR